MKRSEQIQEQALARLSTDLRRGIVRVARRLRAMQPPTGITPARLSVLRLLHHQGEMTAGEIAAAESLQPQSVTRLLAALERDGLIVRHADPGDRRRSVAGITAAGTRVLRTDTARRDEWLAQAMQATLTADEFALLQQASALLDRLADAPAS